MRPTTIPIRPMSDTAAGDDEGFSALALPHEMSTFEMPSIPPPGPGHDIAGARDVLRAFVERLGSWLEAGGDLPALELAGIDAAVLRVLNETLGEGDVCATVEADHDVRVQETVFAGVWRQQHVDGTRMLHDVLLAAPIPPIVASRAAARAGPALRALPLPPGAMNVPALLHELQEAMDRCTDDTPPHVVNLTLLPLSPEDAAHLDTVLAGGAVAVLSRGFGNCRISSTAARNVWRVQYFNNMQTLILNTIEVVAMPQAALAAREDLVETQERLADLVRWMSEAAAA